MTYTLIFIAILLIVWGAVWLYEIEYEISHCKKHGKKMTEWGLQSGVMKYICSMCDAEAIQRQLKKKRQSRPHKFEAKLVRDVYSYPKRLKKGKNDTK